MLGKIVCVGGVQVEIRVWLRNGYFWGRNVKTQEMKFYVASVLEEQEQVKQITRRIRKLF